MTTFLLLCEPGCWRALQDDPSLIPGAVEELLRYLTVVQWGFTRTATENADPDRFDLTRRPSGHLAFGYGRHNCVGKHLARSELQITIAGLVREFPSLRLAEPPERVPFHSDDRQFRGVQRLLVDW